MNFDRAHGECITVGVFLLVYVFVYEDLYNAVGDGSYAHVS